MADAAKLGALDLPLEEVGVPQAIGLMMQAASNTREVTHVTVDDDMVGHATLRTNDDMLQLLCEKLEARIEDELESVQNPQIAPDEEVEDRTYSDIDGHAVTLVKEHREESDQEEIMRVIVDGTVFGLLCNERVITDPDTLRQTTCIKAFDHDGYEHEDMEGNTR